ncbi:MAG TPA: DUF5615 family PIN-like protein [Parafilimonas sp.]|nr:DUF5615 family PIN-like protein [Parafilimonas sp.]
MNAISFFADENIQHGIIEWLQKSGWDISGIRLENLYALSDELIIDKAYNEQRIILTQDGDFGRIIYTQKVKFYCIVYLRPGHYDFNYHIPTITRIIDNIGKINEGTIIVGVRKEAEIKIRIRHIDFNI